MIKKCSQICVFICSCFYFTFAAPTTEEPRAVIEQLKCKGGFSPAMDQMMHINLPEIFRRHHSRREEMCEALTEQIFQKNFNGLWGAFMYSRGDPRGGYYIYSTNDILAEYGYKGQFMTVFKFNQYAMATQTEDSYTVIDTDLELKNADTKTKNLREDLIVLKKGRGFSDAEEDAILMHFVDRFEENKREMNGACRDLVADMEHAFLGFWSCFAYSKNDGGLHVMAKNDGYAIFQYLEQTTVVLIRVG